MRPAASPAKRFARELAQAYRGRVKRDEFDWQGAPPNHFQVRGVRGGRALTFWVVEGGCLVEGTTLRKPPLAFSLNHRFSHIEQRLPGVVPDDALPLFRVKNIHAGKAIPAQTLRALDEYVRALWQDERGGLLALGLGRQELLALLPQPLFVRGRPTFFLLHRSPDLALLESRLEILDRLFPAPPEGSEIARRISETAYRIRIGARAPSEARHRFGGALEPALPCPNCGTPIHRILSIDTEDPALRLPALGRRHFPVAFCLNCMSWGTLYVNYGRDALRVVRQDKAEKVNDDDAVEVCNVSLAPIASASTSASKVGGAPFWIQGPAVPDCAGCGKPMVFFAQIKSLPSLAFGDAGVLYSFVCPDCRISASLIQSH